MPATKRRMRSTLRFDVIDLLAEACGASNNTSRAALFGIHRTNLIRLRNGGTPSLDVAMDIAAALNIKVDQIVERQPTDADGGR